ncbi:sodium-translocating pyrophosphatase [Candidatus Sumerlaeota bacterium]|nr:sodium-translocating pyrophosphatase [Candidatus Sumerlaeota bacterium]
MDPLTLTAPALASMFAIGFVLYLINDVMKKSPGNKTMRDISGYVQEGAAAFLKREYTYVSIFVIVIAALILIFGGEKINLPRATALAFVAGAVASALAGFTGMWIATRCNARTTQGAVSGGLQEALSIAVSGGAVMGMSVVGISILGLCIICMLTDNIAIINGYAMGASLVALFGRSGGGIFTKGADMGADLVGKVEAGIPEDDPRNPATIADNVGDNVGDVAGLGADLLESYVESIIAAMAIAYTVGTLSGNGDAVRMSLIQIPLWIAAIGIIASIIGVFVVKAIGKTDAQKSLMIGTYAAAGITFIGSILVIGAVGTPYGNVDAAGVYQFGKWGPLWASLAGIVSGILVGFMSEYYTSSKYNPVKNMAQNSQYGPAITVTDGIAIGMKSTGIPVIVLAIAVLVAFGTAGFYGVAIAALGMLATTGIIVTVDSYGPIADNAGGIAEMAHLEPGIRKITDNLDSVGNTTAAIGKGFAIGSAAFAAMALLSAFMQTAHIRTAELQDAYVIAGLLIGAMLPYFFSSMLFKAVSNCAFRMIAEVRRQIREIPGIMEGTGKPEYATCVDISTKYAIQGMLLPGLMAILVPVVFGVIPFLLGFEDASHKLLSGVLVGSLVSGVMLGLQCANSGGAMDNAKKYIEEGKVTDDDGVVQGKGSACHKAAVIGDTVGDPLKDTVGPSINILIKLMAVISLVLAPIMASAM